MHVRRLVWPRQIHCLGQFSGMSERQHNLKGIKGDEECHLRIFVVSVRAHNCQRKAQCCEKYCYDLNNVRTQLAHFGTKTAYQIIKGSESGRLNR